MTEAIRFYWRGRDASIPLGEIPEQDRTPLRIRRSVVQKYTPLSSSSSKKVDLSLRRGREVGRST